MPFLRRVSACACVYRHTTSPRLSLWKSQGETTTMSPSRIQTRRFILPRIRHNRSLPSWHFTMMRSKPSSFTTTPKTSPCEGYTISLSSPSLSTFFLPKHSTSRFSFEKNGLPSLKACSFKQAQIDRSTSLACRVFSRNCGVAG